jgi:hypothetical protein
MADRLRVALIICALGLFTGVGAVLGQEVTPEPLLNPSLLVDTSLLTGEPCAAPCWRGITPGETSWDDALAILQADPALANVQVQEDANSDAKAATWTQIDGEECCQIFSLDGQTVSVLFLRLAPDITLDEVIEVNGEPAFAIGSPFTDAQAIVNLIYPEARTVVFAYVSRWGGSLSAESEVGGAMYLSPQDLDLLLGTSNLYEWRGYADYATYNPDAGAFDVTPSVTVTPTGG